MRVIHAKRPKRYVERRTPTSLTEVYRSWSSRGNVSFRLNHDSEFDEARDGPRCSLAKVFLILYRFMRDRG